MALQVLALACLVGAIVLGFVKKMNVGIVCLGLALVLGTIGGISSGDIYKGFPYKLFATLLGTMLFFSLLQQNGTLEKVSQKLISLCGKNTFLVPIIVYLVSFGLSAAGPGAISVQSVTVLFAVSLAVQMEVSPVLMGSMAILGAVGGTASPIALTGIIVEDLLAEMEIGGMGMKVFLGVSIANFICAAATYVALGGYKIRRAAAGHRFGGGSERRSGKTRQSLCGSVRSREIIRRSEPASVRQSGSPFGNGRAGGGILLRCGPGLPDALPDSDAAGRCG